MENTKPCACGLRFGHSGKHAPHQPTRVTIDDLNIIADSILDQLETAERGDIIKAGPLTFEIICGECNGRGEIDEDEYENGQLVGRGTLTRPCPACAPKRPQDETDTQGED